MRERLEVEQCCEHCEHWVRIMRGDGLLIKDWHCECEVKDEDVADCTKFEALDDYPSDPSY